MKSKSSATTMMMIAIVKIDMSTVVESHTATSGTLVIVALRFGVFPKLLA
jgi:hypothetical protein